MYSTLSRCDWASRFGTFARSAGLAALLLCTPALCLSAGGSEGQDVAGAAASSPDQILRSALARLEPFHPVMLNTEAVASKVRAGDTLRLPFVAQGNHLGSSEVQLSLRNLRDASLIEAQIKDGMTGRQRTVFLPPPATYQGTVQGRVGVAVFTINDDIVEGNIIEAPPRGWSIIEPLEPLLRLYGVDAKDRAKVLKRYNHIVYNARDVKRYLTASDAALLAGAQSTRSPKPDLPATPLVLSAVLDGDDAFYRAYPADSIVPFWLKGETMFNVFDWLLNCSDPDAYANNVYARCGNNFDGGTDSFRARVRLDRLEVWSAGGPNTGDLAQLWRDSRRYTHQADGCCGAPHTAGRSSSVYFFSGRTQYPGAGVASIKGLYNYGEGCTSEQGYNCHHAVSQMTPSEAFTGSSYMQELLVTHEMGHIIGAEEDFRALHECWLFNEVCGPSLMASIVWTHEAPPIFRFNDTDAKFYIAPFLEERLKPY